MKALKYIVAIALVSGLAACDGNRSNATLGGTQDTTAVAGSGDNGTSAAGIDSNKTDTTNRGNADPSGRGSSDTLNDKPAH
jgi:hypothetical protein